MVTRLNRLYEGPSPPLNVDNVSSNCFVRFRICGKIFITECKFEVTLRSDISDHSGMTGAIAIKRSYLPITRSSNLNRITPGLTTVKFIFNQSLCGPIDYNCYLFTGLRCVDQIYALELVPRSQWPVMLNLRSVITV